MNDQNAFLTTVTDVMGFMAFLGLSVIFQQFLL
jgi:Mg/Co/Ni transporter MgtE